MADKIENKELDYISRLRDWAAGCYKPPVVKLGNEKQENVINRTKGIKLDRIPIEKMYVARDINPNPISSSGERPSVKNPEDYVGSYYGWTGPKNPEYNMLEPLSIFDTEAYVKQSVNRKISLMFRNGFEIIGSDRNVKYIQDRIATMEYVMGRTFRSLLKKILWCLCLQSNCFLLKIRKESASGISKKDGGKIPIAGYTIIPAHQLEPILQEGILVKWRRYYESGRPFDDIPKDDILHFKWDDKPWHIFGTPRTVAVRDDIHALRKLEENVELLFINFLFPLYHVRIGTESNPASYDDRGISELEMVKEQIQSMPKEGVFVTDERSEVEVVGASSSVLDFMSHLNYYKARVFAGLGVSGLDMGETNTISSGSSDNISQNLKDAIKADVEDFAEQIKMLIFKEWFLEANHALSVQSAVKTTSLIFHEIDLDNKIKDENHILNMYNSNLIAFAEARKRLKYPEDSPIEEFHIDRDTVYLVQKTEAAKASAQIKVLKVQAEVMPKPTTAAASSTKKTSTGRSAGRPQASSTPKKVNSKAGSIKQTVTPTNQHGTNLGPTKAKSSLEAIELLKDELVNHLEIYNDACEQGKIEASWKEIVTSKIDEAFYNIDSDDLSYNDYTKQVKESSPYLKDIIAGIRNPEELAIMLDYLLTPEMNDGLNVEKSGNNNSRELEAE